MKDKVLVVTAPDVSNLKATQVHVRARALPLGTYYRMDASVSTAGSIEWPLNAVIAPVGIQADSLGVIGWIVKEAHTIYVPVSVLPKGQHVAPQSPAIAIFRSSHEIDRVRWRLRARGTKDRLPNWQDLGGNGQTTIRAGEPIPIELPIETSSQPLNFDIDAKQANSGNWLHTQLQVFIP